MASIIFFFFFEWYGDHRDLHSFPTRRSSDLAGRALGRREGPVVRTLGDGREAAQHLTPVLATVVAAPHLAGGRGAEEREGFSPVLQAHRLEGRPQWAIGEPVAYRLPGLPAVGAPGDAGAGVVVLKPAPRSLLGRGHEH